MPRNCRPSPFLLVQPLALLKPTRMSFILSRREWLPSVGLLPARAGLPSLLALVPRLVAM